MLRQLRAIAFCLPVIILAGCHSLPDNARYIPKNAIMVLGLNTGEIGKKMAWNVLTGSKMFKQIREKQNGDTIGLDPEAMGIDLSGTTYVYLKTDKRFNNGNRITALIPLDDAGKWEAFVKKTFPAIAFKEAGKHKDVLLAEGMYAGWNDDLLIIMNTLQVPEEYNNMLSQTQNDIMGYDSTDTPDVPIVTVAPEMNEAELVEEMDAAFSLNKENALTENKRFSKLERNGHDITLWINYDEIMSAYMGGSGAGMMGISLSNVLWKDAAFTAGFDFEKGKITGKMLYYSPEEMKEVAKEMARDNADREMVKMLPLQNPDMFFTWHLSPKGIKGTLEKVGMLGFVNLALSGQGMNTDYIFEALTGDMAMVVNDFNIIKQDAIPDSTGLSYQTSFSGFNTKANYAYVLKINKKENFNKLLQLAIGEKALTHVGNNVYTYGNVEAKVAVNDHYLVLANNAEYATGILQGKFKAQQPDKFAQSVDNYPVAMYFNIAKMLAAIPASIAADKDAIVLSETKNLMEDIAFTGGKFKNDAFEYDLSLNFNNKKENALILIIDYMFRISNASETVAKNQ